MKKTLVLFVFMIVNSANSYCQTTEERNLSAFDKLKVGSEVRVFLTKGNEEKVKIIASGIELSDIETTVNGKTLQIELSRGIHIDASVELYITYKEIREINVGASGLVSLQNPLTGDKVVLNANTNGQLQAELSLKTVDIKVGQGATMRLSGKTGSMDAKVSTGGILSALDVQSDSTYIRVGSGGTAKVNVTQLLDANVRTGGTLIYSGAPKQNKIKTGIGATVNILE
ncbi:MAG: DUF2807 domain-containing protein [Bacteroidales bacterium]|nr:DUF2807 domain-containing protein [Bacteroidales bacterium]